MQDKNKPMLRSVREIDIEYRSLPENCSLRSQSSADCGSVSSEACKQPLYSEIKRKIVKTDMSLVEISKLATYWDKGIPVIYYLNTTDSGGLPVRRPIKFDGMLNKGAIDSSLAFMTGRQKLWENLAKTANLNKPVPWLLIGLILMAVVLGGALGASLYNPLNHTEPINNAPTVTRIWNVTNTITLTPSQAAVTTVSPPTVVTTVTIPANATTIMTASGSNSTR